MKKQDICIFYIHICIYMKWDILQIERVYFVPKQQQQKQLQLYNKNNK